MPDLSWWLESAERLIKAWDDASAEEAIPSLIEDMQGFKFTDRTSRLLACGFCRQAWSLIAHDDCRDAVYTAEKYADGHIDFYEMEMVSRKVWVALAARPVHDLGNMTSATHACVDGNVDGSHDYPHLIDAAAMGVTSAVYDSDVTLNIDIIAMQGRLFASMVGPGWSFNAEWGTATVVQLAGHIYESRDFSLMPILADALQDAGCDESVLLTGLRDQFEQWCRGCRILDVILGKR